MKEKYYEVNDILSVCINVTILFPQHRRAISSATYRELRFAVLHYIVRQYHFTRLFFYRLRLLFNAYLLNVLAQLV